MTQRTYKDAKRRYHTVFWPLMGLYMIVVISGSAYMGFSGNDTLWLKAALGIGMGLPMVGVLFVMVRFFEEADEYTRLLHFRSFAYATVLTIGAIALFGALQMFKAIGPIDVFWFVPAFFLTYGLIYRVLGGKDCL